MLELLMNMIGTNRIGFDLTTFSDDPEMFNMVSDHVTETSAEISHTLQQTLQSLVIQLQQLTLTNGKTTDVIARAAQFLTENGQDAQNADDLDSNG